MKNKLILSVLVLLFTKLLLAQSERPEVILMECMYESYEDNGKGFKIILNDFEEQLVRDKVLEDTTGESYINLLKRLSSGENIKGLDSTVIFIEKFNEINKKNVEKPDACSEMLNKQLETESSKIFMIDKFINSLSSKENVTFSDYIVGLLKILSAEDFELDFYKLKMVHFLSLANMTTN